MFDTPVKKSFFKDKHEASDQKGWQKKKLCHKKKNPVRGEGWGGVKDYRVLSVYHPHTHWTFNKATSLTLHGFSKALPRLPAMFLKQPVPDVILTERRGEKNQKYSNNKRSFSLFSGTSNPDKLNTTFGSHFQQQPPPPPSSRSSSVSSSTSP